MFVSRFSPKNLVRATRSSRSRLRRYLSEYRFFAYLAILGPGLISANAGNDASGIATYSTVGAGFGYSLLWVFVPMVLSLIVVQEMCARMGVVTGQGLADLIREHFGVCRDLTGVGAAWRFAFHRDPACGWIYLVAGCQGFTKAGRTRFSRNVPCLFLLRDFGFPVGTRLA